MADDNTSKSILIVEDESIIALNLKYDLEDLGYNVIGIVDTGDDAIDNAVEYRPDLTIMDINLKGDINGIQAAKKILALDLAVIYLTANSDDITFNETISTSPASSFIPKPYDINTLSKNVALAINRQSVESEKVNEARGIAKDKDQSEDVLQLESGKRELIESAGENVDYQNYLEYADLQQKAKEEYKLSDNAIRHYKEKDPDEKEKIIVVEDESIVALNLKYDLEDLGYEVIDTFDTATDAIEKSEELFPDLVLMDIQLKGDVDGIQAAKEISEMGIPVIFLTANTDDATSFEALKTAPYGYLSKPYSLKQLELTVAMVLRKHEEDIKTIIKTEDKVSEKNKELIVEKTDVAIILGISIILIVESLFMRNVTWLQWVLLIPSAIMVFLAIVSLKKPDPVTEWDVPPFVTLIVPAHNEEHTIAETATSLASMDYYLDGKVNFELIVCNDGSEDRTGEVLEGLKDKFPHLKIITRVPPRSGKGKGFVLNDALEISKGEVVAVFDADARVDPDFLTKIIPYLNDPEVQGVQSRIKMYNKDENWLTYMQHVELAGFGNIVRAKDILGKAGFLGGNGQLVKKDAIYGGGGWDGFAITEDLNLSVKLMIEGYAIRYCGETWVYQEAVPTLRQLFRQRARWAIGNFETLFIYGVKIIRSPMPVFRMFGVLEHVAFYGLNMLVFFGFIVFAVNLIGWFVFHGVTIIRMDAPLIIGIISAFGFFPGAVITLARDRVNFFKLLYGVFGYWLYCFHLIPLFFITAYQMLTRKERTWAKTVHTGDEEVEGVENEDIPVGEIE
ncbi:MAG: response regulator [Methanobrevibacter sp.]|uniref:response regulator n=1 Tax=Methanobrevibacter sp. TaxID=66852 RepID=UPI0025D27C77|nr:response regulator [Methanobrevibacter sp.]MBE6496966.1 response regulator [Methanobrevibacter sp.]